MKITTIQDMKHLEQKANAAGLPYKQMMENAGNGLAAVLLKRIGSSDRSTLIIGLVGPGNNGGDTLIALDGLATAGWHTISFCYKRDIEKDGLCQKLKSAGGVVVSANEEALEKILGESVYKKIYMLDGFLGTGFKLPVEPELAGFLGRCKEIIEHKQVTVIAVDCPSGINCANGEVDEAALKADLTVCMAAIKVGMLEFPAFDYVGEIEVVDIGLEQLFLIGILS